MQRIFLEPNLNIKMTNDQIYHYLYYLLLMNEIYENTSFVSLEWNINRVCNYVMKLRS